MIGLNVSVPIACFRVGRAREYLQTELIPPPSTCYGFLLSLVGEVQRDRHAGCRVTAGRFGEARISVVLRTVWRVKRKPLGTVGNARPDYQQLMTNNRFVIWLDSGDEASDNTTLEQRVRQALIDPGVISRFGGLSLGESTHLVDQVSLVDVGAKTEEDIHTFLLHDQGRLNLPVWVDHVGSMETRYVRGNLERGKLKAPRPDRIPKISQAP